MSQYFVYILKCADGSYYTGITNDVDRRFEEHQSGYGRKAYTFTRRPLELVFYLDFPDPVQAIDFEKQVKDWTRKKKEAIIRGDWESLKELAACKNETSHLGFDSAQPDSGFVKFEDSSVQPDSNTTQQFSSDSHPKQRDGHPERSRREPERYRQYKSEINK